MRIHLITHAHTTQLAATDARTWRLSPLGEQQATALAGQPWWGQIDLVAVSSEAKTRLTVAPLLAQRSLPLMTDGNLDELRRGGWVDDYPAQVAQAFVRPDVPAGEWEAATDAYTRFEAGIAAVCARAMALPARRMPDGPDVALVSHGLVLSLYRAALLGQHRVDWDAWRGLSFCAVAVVDPLARVLLHDFRPVAGHQPRA